MNTSLKKILAESRTLAAAVGSAQVGKRDLVPDGFLAVCIDGDRTSGVRKPGQRIEPSAGEVLLVRDCPWSIDLPSVELTTSDRLRAQCWIAMQVRPRAEAAELASLRRQVMDGRPVLDAEVLERWLTGPAVASLRALGGQVCLQDLIELTTAERLGEQLSERLAGPLFRAGLQLSGVVGLSFSSDDYEVKRKAERQAVLAEDLSRLEDRVSQVRHEARSAELNRLATMLGQLDELNAKLAPAGDPAQRARQLGELLMRFAPADREAFAAGTLELAEAVEAATHAPTVLVAAGREVHRLAIDSGESQVLPGCEQVGDELELGPVRSICVEGGSLLVGARDGVARMKLNRDATTAEVAQVYLIPDTVTRDRRRRRGVNSAAVIGDLLLATHGEAGLLAWSLNDPTSGRVVIPAAEGQYMRAVTRGPDGNVLLGRDNALVACDPHGSGSGDLLLVTRKPVSAIAADLDGWWVGDESGGLWRFTETAASQVATLGGPIGSIQPIVLGCLCRLLVSAGPGGLLMFQPQINASTQVPAGGGGVRLARHAGGWTAALCNRRDRVLLWSPGRVAEPDRDVRLYARIGHSLQDIAMV